MTIFKAYDIRGQYPKELNEGIAYAIGRAFVTLTQTKDVMVGRDSRTHSPLLAEALIRGLTDQGANVTDIGLATTPQVIAMHAWKGHHTAIMITASHLEAPFNGMKMYAPGGTAINRRHGMQEIEALVTRNVFTTTHKGTVHTTDYTAEYAQRIEQLQPTRSKLHFVVDCSNGAAGPEVLIHKEKLGLNFTLMNTAPDGAFPHHSPDPLAKNAQDPISRMIRKQKAAGGCIFDADADRIVFLDEQGSFIRTNWISCLIIRELLRRRPGRVVAYDLISSQVVPQVIADSGGVPLRTVVGRNLLAEDARANDAIFGAEMSSHMIYGDVAYADASTLTLLLVLDLLTRSGKKFSELVQEFEKYSSYERNYLVPNPDAAMRAIEAAFPDAQRDYLDGITLSFNDSWLVVRKSNTEPLLRLRGEGDTHLAIETRFKTAERIIFQQGGTLHYV